jgi:hypothetical protein
MRSEAHVVPRKDSILLFAEEGLRNSRVKRTCKRKSRPDVHPSATSANPTMASHVGRFGPTKALRILSTSKGYARQTLIQSAFMIRTGLLPVADCQSCFVAVARPPDPPSVTPSPTRIHTRGSSHGECMPTVRVWLSSSPYWGIETCGCTERVMCGSTVYLW